MDFSDVVIGVQSFVDDRLVCRGTPEGPCVQKFANLAEARKCGGLEIVFNQQ